jgi:16S rRNA processing protein RimM
VGSSPTLVEIGRVSRPHGLQGCLQIVLFGDDPANFLAAERIVLSGGPGSIPYRIERADSVGPTSGGGLRLRVWLEGIEDRERAASWAGAWVSIAESDIQPLPEGEYYWRDLLGLRCVTSDGTAIGTLDEIWPTGAEDLLVINDGDRQTLVPARDEVLVRVDLEKRELCVDLGAALLEANS